MNPPTHITAAVAELAVCCKGGKADEITVRLFAKYLADATPKAVALAVTRWCSSNTFFPSVHELRTMLESESGKVSASDAWEEACSWVARVGYCGQPKWSSPAVERAAIATCGSWEAFCTSPTEQLPSKRARFFEIFGEFAATAKSGQSELTAAKLLEIQAPRTSRPDVRELAEGDGS